MAKTTGVSQHKQMAMGQEPKVGGIGSASKYARGGMVKGIPTSPITDVKRANGIPGMKKGGKAGCC
jgi:hypothetical protein